MRHAYKWLVGIAFAALLIWAMVYFVREANGQVLEADGHGRIEAWARPHFSYQHRMEASGSMTARWRSWFIRPKLTFERWSASDAKIPSAMLNAESNKVFSRWQSLAVGYSWRGVDFGVQYDRRSVHHVWRHKSREDRHDHFPGNWQLGRRGVSPDRDPDEPQRPSIGYWDGIRPSLAYHSQRVDVQVLGPLVRWKTLTLPWPLIRLRAALHLSPWHLKGYLQGARHRAWRGSVRLQRGVTDRLRVEAVYAVPPLPEWRDRTANVISVGIYLH